MAWRFHDPVTDETYTPPFGPSGYSSPLRERMLTDRATTSRRGKILTWEGEPRPMDWTARGRVLTSEHYQALQEWVAKPYRIIVVDELDREWVTYLLSFAATPKRAYQVDWSFEVTIRGVIFERNTLVVLP